MAHRSKPQSSHVSQTPTGSQAQRIEVPRTQEDYGDFDDSLDDNDLTLGETASSAYPLDLLLSSTGSEDTSLSSHDSDGTGIDHQLCPKDGESFSQWTAQVPGHDTFNSVEQPRTEASRKIVKEAGNKKKRMREQDGWSARLKKKMANFELLCRVYFLIDLNKTRGDFAKKYCFDKIEDPEERDDAYEYAHKKLLSLNHTWKYQTLLNFREFIDRTANAPEHVRFRRENSFNQIQLTLQEMFTLSEFVGIFDMCKTWISIEMSKFQLKRWCLAIFIDLGACLKMEWNALNNIQPPPLAPGEERQEYNKAYIFRRFDEYATEAALDEFRPQVEDVHIEEKHPKVKPAKPKPTEKPRANGHLYLPTDIGTSFQFRTV